MLLTTHYMAEAEELCDRIAVIAGGEIQALGTADELKHHAEGRRVLEVQAFGVSDEQWPGSTCCRAYARRASRSPAPRSC